MSLASSRLKKDTATSERDSEGLAGLGEGDSRSASHNKALEGAYDA